MEQTVRCKATQLTGPGHLFTAHNARQRYQFAPPTGWMRGRVFRPSVLISNIRIWKRWRINGPRERKPGGVRVAWSGQPWLHLGWSSPKFLRRSFCCFAPRPLWLSHAIPGSCKQNEGLWMARRLFRLMPRSCSPFVSLGHQLDPCFIVRPATLASKASSPFEEHAESF